MEVKVIGEFGFDQAMLGLSLNKNQPVDKMYSVAMKLASQNGGHNKFLEMIVLYIDISAPRYWWSQMDTYRLVTKQSESTMHTILKRPLTEEDFVPRMIGREMLQALNILIEAKQFEILKGMLPEAFIQRRVVMLSYKTLRNIIKQRLTHRLKEWFYFIDKIYEQVEHKEFIADLLKLDVVEININN